MSVDLLQRLIFRMVHFENMEYLLENGMCCKNHPNADLDYINIGDASLIGQRNDYIVGINPPGGNLGEYVPFYFGGHSPMLLNIKTGYRGVTKRSQQDIVFICCKIEQVIQECKKWCFTDGHAKNRMTEFFNDAQDLDKVDWQMVRAQIWHPIEGDEDRFRRKQAEFLVKGLVPVTCIHSLFVKSQTRKEELEVIIKKLGLNVPVKIDSENNLFYPC